jgi:signal recognition particle subunit SRP54
MLGDKLRNIFDKFSSKHIISEGLIDETVKEIQKALIVSDVDISLVSAISKQIKELKKIKAPDDVDKKEFLIKKIYDILAGLFGKDNEIPSKPKKILLCGLFGSGKTTTAAKLASFYKKRKMDVGLIGADVFRMAAYEQLKQFAKGFDVFGGVSESADETVKQGLKQLKSKDLIIVDSAGRSGLDDELVDELKSIKKAFKPDITFLVLPADIGQIALEQANKFNEAVELNGIILTKMDGSAKGGGALAACASLEIPVYFIGTGEKLNDLDTFEPMRYLSSIMGYGDLKGLLDRVSEFDMSPEDLDKFDFYAFKKQLKMTKKIGSLGKIAGMMGLGKGLDANMMKGAQDHMEKFNYIIDSMTDYERKYPDSLNVSRMRRISKGSGTSVNDVRLLLKQFNTMQDTFGMFKGKTEKDLENFDQNNIKDLLTKKMKTKMMKKQKLKIR